jgi:hypothetical protein
MSFLNFLFLSVSVESTKLAAGARAELAPGARDLVVPASSTSRKRAPGATRCSKKQAVRLRTTSPSASTGAPSTRNTSRT